MLGWGWGHPHEGGVLVTTGGLAGTPVPQLAEVELGLSLETQVACGISDFSRVLTQQPSFLKVAVLDD